MGFYPKELGDDTCIIDTTTNRQKMVWAGGNQSQVIKQALEGGTKQKGDN